MSQQRMHQWLANKRHRVADVNEASDAETDSGQVTSL